MLLLALFKARKVHGGVNGFNKKFSQVHIDIVAELPSVVGFRIDSFSLFDQGGLSPRSGGKGGITKGGPGGCLFVLLGVKSRSKMTDASNSWMRWDTAVIGHDAAIEG